MIRGIWNKRISTLLGISLVVIVIIITSIFIKNQAMSTGNAAIVNSQTRNIELTTNPNALIIAIAIINIAAVGTVLFLLTSPKKPL